MNHKQITSSEGNITIEWPSYGQLFQLPFSSELALLLCSQSPGVLESCWRAVGELLGSCWRAVGELLESQVKVKQTTQLNYQTTIKSQ